MRLKRSNGVSKSLERLEAPPTDSTASGPEEALLVKGQRGQRLQAIGPLPCLRLNTVPMKDWKACDGSTSTGSMALL